MAAYFGGRIDLSRRTLVLVVGDAAAIALFVAVGELRHGGSFLAGLTTFSEFLIGWLVAAPVLGAYAIDALGSPGKTVGTAVGGWLVGGSLGLVVRAVIEPGFYIAPSFAAVALSVGGVVLAAWRGLALSLVS